MQIDDRLEGYEVTTVPARPDDRLHLVWSAPDTGAEGAGPTPQDDVDRGSADGDATVLPLLTPYRITRIPNRSAS